MQTTTETRLGTLTKKDLTILRKAAGVSFHHLYGRSSIKVELVGKKAGVTVKGEYDIQTGAEFWGGFQGSMSEQDLREGATCFASVMRTDECWQTIVSLLRPDDVLTLVWHSDTGLICEKHNHGRYTDELTLQVIRKPGPRATAFFFRVTYLTTWVNSRMIRPPEPAPAEAQPWGIAVSESGKAGPIGHRSETA